MQLADFTRTDNRSPQNHPIADMIRAVVLDANRLAPRSQQVAIGPSEIGEPCARRLAYKIMHQPPSNLDSDPWAAIVGTATHTWLADAFTAANTRLSRPRFLVEKRLEIVPGLYGNCDLYDVDTATVIDHKGLALDTPMPTPTGWTTMHDVAIGDALLDKEGNPCIVLDKSSIHRDRPCYRITFEDNSSIVADNVHRWELWTGAKGDTLEILSTEEAAHHVWSKAKRPQRDLRVANNGALTLPPANLPIHPYVLGAWLGDGSRRNAQIGKPDDALFEQIEKCGYQVSAPIGARKLVRNVYGLARELRLAGLICNKHIPVDYLRGSYDQRLELLRGLMDTDGSWNQHRKEAVFSNCDEALARAVAELVRTLGWRALVSPQKAFGFGRAVDVWQIKFVPFEANPFHLPRKAALVRVEGSIKCRRRVVKSIESTLSVPTQCVTVSSPSNTFLCGEQMTVTHNCVGPSSMAKYKKGEPPPYYHAQAHLYGKGYARLGLPVRTVALAYYPRNGTLSGLHVWSEPFDETIADAALQRYFRIIEVAVTLDVEHHPELFKAFPREPGHRCTWCPYWKPGTDTGVTCPGHLGAAAA